MTPRLSRIKEDRACRSTPDIARIVERLVRQEVLKAGLA
jgi:hypothetical protein